MARTKMNYQRLTEIDSETVRLKRLLEDIKKGHDYIDVWGLTSKFYCYINIRVERETMGISWSDTAEYKVLAKYICGIFEDQIKKLKDEKEQILGKKWYQFWK